MGERLYADLVAKGLDFNDGLNLIYQAMWGGFYRCPTNGRILEALPGDDKVMCSCRTSNPRVRSECTEVTGVHIIRFLQAATVEEYVDEHGPWI